LTFALAALLAGAAGCSDSKSGAEHFVGTWTYAGMITPNCGTTAVNPIDLTGYSATITEIDSSHITVALGTVCTVKFDVDGFSASAEANQSCMFDVGTFGPQTVSITKWTLKSTTPSRPTSRGRRSSARRPARGRSPASATRAPSTERGQ
jgi:hypothetical protein